MMKYLVVLVLLIALDAAVAHAGRGRGRGRGGRRGGPPGNNPNKQGNRLNCANITQADCEALPPMRLCDDDNTYTNWCDYMKRVKCPQQLRGKPEGLFPCDEEGAPIPKTNLGRRRHLKIQAKCARIATEDCSTKVGPRICDSSNNSTYENKCFFMKEKCADLSSINFETIFKCDADGNPVGPRKRQQGGRRRCGRKCRDRNARQPQ